MRKYHVKPNLESYAAVLSCLGNMDLFDPSVARRIILDLERQVRVMEAFLLDIYFALCRVIEWWIFSILIV